MLNLNELSTTKFLNNYWQKKPLLIRNALPDFSPMISADEIAGLATDEDMDSKLIIENPNLKNEWQIKKGPLKNMDFNQLPDSHWSCLVYGVDKVIPPISQLFDKRIFYKD